MRLYEFTNPQDYILPDPEAADPSELIGRVKCEDKGDDSEFHLTKQWQTEKPTLPSTASV